MLQKPSSRTFPVSSGLSLSTFLRWISASPLSSCQTMSSWRQGYYFFFSAPRKFRPVPGSDWGPLLVPLSSDWWEISKDALILLLQLYRWQNQNDSNNDNSHHLLNAYYVQAPPRSFTVTHLTFKISSELGIISHFQRTTLSLCPESLCYTALEKTWHTNNKTSSRIQTSFQGEPYPGREHSPGSPLLLDLVYWHSDLSLLFLCTPLCGRGQNLETTFLKYSCQMVSYSPPTGYTSGTLAGWKPFSRSGSFRPP